MMAEKRATAREAEEVAAEIEFESEFTGKQAIDAEIETEIDTVKEQQEMFLAARGGRFVAQPHERTGFDLTAGVKIFETLSFIQSQKHAQWYSNLYANYDAYQAGKILETAVERTAFNGDEYDALMYFESDLIQLILTNIARLSQIDKADLVRRWKIETGQITDNENRTGETDAIK